MAHPILKFESPMHVQIIFSIPHVIYGQRVKQSYPQESLKKQ